jgi:hypothetical protein
LLESIRLSDKRYNEILDEAIEKIPTLTDEWTNFNRSDPGITILQNLSAFAEVQRDSLDEVTDEVKLGLLSLLGYRPGENMAAHVWASVPRGHGFTADVGDKLMTDDICFEPESEISVTDWGVTGLFTYDGAAMRDITYLRAGTQNSGFAVFGSPAKVGAAFYVILDDIPDNIDKIDLLVRVMNEERRNEPEDPAFCLSSVEWQCYTNNGWETVAAEDETNGFLKSGLVHLGIRDLEKEIFQAEGTAGYAFRCLLTEESYDVAPRLHSVMANLFPLKQKDTKIRRAFFAHENGIVVVRKNRYAPEGYSTVFCDENGKGLYRAYSSGQTGSSRGRYYEKSETDDAVILKFNKRRFGFGPGKSKTAVCVVTADKQSAEHTNLGPLYGYEGQEIDIPVFSGLLKEDFCLLAVREERDGTETCSFVTPMSTSGFSYDVLPDPGRIIVNDSEGFVGAKLHIVSCSLTEGARGNIRAGSDFVPYGGAIGLTGLINYLPASGGQTRESAEILRRRFTSEMFTPTVAVTTSDIESIVKNTPGLSIDKVKAVSSESENKIFIAVMPYSEDPMPGLSEFYVHTIRDYMEKSRMLGTQIELRPPVYVPIDIRAIVFARETREISHEKITAALRGALGGVTGTAEFGATVSYSRLYKALEQFDNIQSIYDFSLILPDTRHAKKDGPDIILDFDAIYCPGSITLEVR